MSNNLKISVFIVAFFMFLICFLIFKKGRMPLKYFLIWLLPCSVVLLVAIVPILFEKIILALGFQTISNMVIGLLIVILVFICISLTIIISGQQTKITLLIQEVSILKSKVERNEKGNE